MKKLDGKIITLSLLAATIGFLSFFTFTQFEEISSFIMLLLATAIILSLVTWSFSYKINDEVSFKLVETERRVYLETKEEMEGKLNDKINWLMKHLEKKNFIHYSNPSDNINEYTIPIPFNKISIKPDLVPDPEIAQIRKLHGEELSVMQTFTTNAIRDERLVLDKIKKQIKKKLISELVERDLFNIKIVGNGYENSIIASVNVLK